VSFVWSSNKSLASGQKPTAAAMNPTSTSMASALPGGGQNGLARPSPPLSRTNSANSNSDLNNSDGNNNRPTIQQNSTVVGLPRRPSIPRSPPVGARPIKDLPPGAAPLGTIPRPAPVTPSSSSSGGSNPGLSVPLLASQLGRPVNFGDQRNHHQSVGHNAAALLGNPGLLGLSPHHLNILSHTLSPFAALPTGNGRIMTRNINGTLAVTSHPSNESELQIYRVLQRANLLSYYDTFISQGGDDVQQLCEAGEAEFLEIMDLVGMASKPMHVRRLQKALQEWVQNPALFQTPLVPLSNLSTPSAAAAVIRASSSTGGTSSAPGPPLPASAQMPPVASASRPLAVAPSVANSTSVNDSIISGKLLALALI